MGDAAILFMLVLFVGSILVLRLIGAWMLRINDVIKELQEIKYLLKNSQGIQNPTINVQSRTTNLVPPPISNVQPPAVEKSDFV